MKISFQKHPGNAQVGVQFFWRMTLEADAPVVLQEAWIPELCFDFFLLQRGQIRVIDPTRSLAFDLPAQTLKTLYTHPISLGFTPPLVLYGARLSLTFAESFWESPLQANTFIAQPWITSPPDELASFAAEVTQTLQNLQKPRRAAPMFASELQEAAWLKGYSARQKRRFYQAVFGVSRKEMLSIQHVHAFLAQACDFSSQTPHIIHHMDPEVFYDQPHLNRVFKKFTGLSPLEYFEQTSILQEYLMSASYKAKTG